MTSASELFYKRRSRFGRNAVELRGSDSYLDHYDRNRHRHTVHVASVTGSDSRRDRVDVDGGYDSLRRSTHPRQPNQRVAERESVWSEQSSQSASGNRNASENGSYRLRFTANDRLPGAVLLARERVLQRLRGISLSGNRVADAGDLEPRISTERRAETRPFADSLRQEKSKRSPGLTQGELDCLLVENFSNCDKYDDGKISCTLQECGICLESLIEGDKLIRLPCGHRFHRCCLDPWVRICGCCPYCRKDIVITTSKS